MELDVIKSLLESIDERIAGIEESQRITQENISDVFCIIQGLIEKFEEYENTKKFDMYLENQEENMKSLQRMMLEFKGVISMTRANLPKYCDQA